MIVAARLFGVRCHAEDNVLVSLDGKVKPPVTVNPILPDIVGFIVLFWPVTTGGARREVWPACRRLFPVETRLHSSCEVAQ